MAHALLSSFDPELDVRPVPPILAFDDLDEALDVKVFEPATKQVGIHPVPGVVLVGWSSQAHQTPVRDPGMDRFRRLARFPRFVFAVLPQFVVAERE